MATPEHTSANNKAEITQDHFGLYEHIGTSTKALKGNLMVTFTFSDKKIVPTMEIRMEALTRSIMNAATLTPSDTKTDEMKDPLDNRAWLVVGGSGIDIEEGVIATPGSGIAKQILINQLNQRLKEMQDSARPEKEKEIELIIARVKKAVSRFYTEEDDIPGVIQEPEKLQVIHSWDPEYPLPYSASTTQNLETISLVLRGNPKIRRLILTTDHQQLERTRKLNDIYGIATKGEKDPLSSLYYIECDISELEGRYDQNPFKYLARLISDRFPPFRERIEEKRHRDRTQNLIREIEGYS